MESAKLIVRQLGVVTAQERNCLTLSYARYANDAAVKRFRRERRAIYDKEFRWPLSTFWLSQYRRLPAGPEIGPFELSG
jgi:hypothetical protein